MGCNGSKLDSQEAVALCRGRADLLAAAVRHRYALADAQAALAGSYDSIAAPMHLLLQLHADDSPPPHLALPSDRKGGRGRFRGGRHPSSSLPDRHYSSSHVPCESCSSGSESASSPPESPTRRFLPEQQRVLPHPDYFAYAPAEHAFAYPPPLPQSTL